MSTSRSAAWMLAPLTAAAALAARPAAAQGLSAEQVVERNARARGGLEAWRRIETMAWSGHIESASWGGRKVPFALQQARPDRTRFELTVDGRKAVRVFDGTAGWKMRADAMGRPELQPYTAEELSFARGAPVIDGPLMDHAARGATITLAGTANLDGRNTYVLELRLASGTSYRVWIDAESFLEVRYDRELAGPEGRPAVASVRFADYRTVDGVKLPFTIDAGSPDGRTRDKLVIEHVTLNPALDDRTFAKPGTPPLRRRGVSIDTRGAPGIAPGRHAP